MKFKVGDRVKYIGEDTVVENWGTLKKGDVGKVSRGSEPSNPRIEFERNPFLLGFTHSTHYNVWSIENLEKCKKYNWIEL